MWGEDTSRRSMLSSPRNLSPRNVFPGNQRQFAQGINLNCPPAPRPYFRNTFCPVSGMSQQNDSCLSPLQRTSDFDRRSSYPFAKQHAPQRTGIDTSLSSSGFRHAPYSSGRYVPQCQDKYSSPPLEQFPRSAHPKTDTIDTRFTLRNSPSYTSPFVSERKNFGGIPFISDVTAENSPSYADCTIVAPSVTKQEEDSLDYFYNRSTPTEDNLEATPAHSFEKGNSSLDHSVFSHKSNDSYLSDEGNHCDINVNEDSQSRSSFPAIDSSVDIPAKKPSARFFPEDSHHESGDSTENTFKRQKLSHDSVDAQSELEKHIKEVSDSVVGLDYIMEFQKENVPPSLYTYKCSLCNSSVLAKNVLMHILSVKHRLRYLKTKDEDEHSRITKPHPPPQELAAIVAEAAAELESKYGRGSVKVVSDSTTEAKNSDEKKCPEQPFSISPTISAPSILPPGDNPLLDKIPEPPDLKLLNDILTTAQTLQSGSSKELFQFTKTNDELQKTESFPYEVETVQSKWPLGCEIPPPPPLPFADETTSPVPVSHQLSSMPSSPSVAKSSCNVNLITSHPSFSLSGNDCTSETLERKRSLVDESDVIATNLCDAISNKQNCEDRSPSVLPVSPESSLQNTENCDSVNSCSTLKNESVPEVLPALVDGSLCISTNDDSGKISKSSDVSDPVKTCPTIASEPNDDVSSAEFNDETVEAAKAAIFEHLSQCIVRNEEEAELVREIIIKLSERYFEFKLQSVPPDETESLMKALRGGEKEGVKKLASLLYQCHRTANSLTETDGNNPSTCDEFKVEQDHYEFSRNDFSSTSHHVKIAGENENIKTNQSNSNQSSPQEDGKSLNSKVIALESSSALTGSETKLTSSDQNAANSLDMNIVCVPAKEAAIEKCSRDTTTQKDEGCHSDALKFPLVPPPPPPPPPPDSESSVQMASYGGWPMTFYPGTSQTSSYMYWHNQNMAGLDPSVMNTQFMAPGAQNAEAGLYSWCSQLPPPPPPSEGTSHPPLPPPPPPPPPPPTSCAP